MSLVSSLRQRGARTAFVLVLVTVTFLGVAAMAAAAGPDILPVEPDGGIGGEVILPVEPDGGIGD